MTLDIVGTQGTFLRSECATFRKTSERFGGLSNMAGGYMLRVNGVLIKTSEALYQACRFPQMPEVQRLILQESSPMAAKMKSKPFRDKTRPDWEQVKVEIMRWCLKVKLVQHWSRFGALLRETGNKRIVEESHKDKFWGAVSPKKDQSILVGENVLGFLLEEMRDLSRGERMVKVSPIPIEGFLLMGQPIL